MDVSTNLFIDSIEVGIGPYAFGNFISPYVTPLVCSSYFVIYADTINQNHYFITDSITGFAPYHYLWSWGDGNYDSIPYPSHIYLDSGFYNICLTITDSLGCTSTSCDSSFHILRTANAVYWVDVINSNFTTGILKNGINSISLFPNPTTNLLTISLPDNNIKSCTINLYDMLGEKVLGELRMENGELRIDVSTLSQGIYFLEVNMDGEKVVRKVVKL
jgi:PKD repeat protein